jgi:hypothetical protein
MVKKSSFFISIFAVVILVSLAVGIVTAATITQNITYQGKLTDAAGNPLTGDYSVTFKLYAVSSGGIALATDTHTVQASKGLFTTQITADPSFFDGRALWLGIKVGADPEMTPRQEIRPVPYALSLRPGARILTHEREVAISAISDIGTGVQGESSTSIGVSGVSQDFAGVSGSSNTYFGVMGSSLTNAGVYGKGKDGGFFTTNGPGTEGYWNSCVNISSENPWIKGVLIEMGGEYTKGIDIITTGFGSPALKASTGGESSNGVDVVTYGESSIGVHAVSSQATGIKGRTSSTDEWVPAVYGENNGAGDGIFGSGGRYGVYGYSQNNNGVYGQTAKTDHKYGIYTPDYLYAKGTQVPATDVAEYMPVAENVTSGAVMVIGEDGKLQPSTTAYDTKVAGIVSTEPGVTLGTKETGNSMEQIIAVAGRVPCKVDASNGPIHPGDLLTTSDKPGYAMKATNPQIGTILGKAMGTLESGTGTIEVLVTLQ